MSLELFGLQGIPLVQEGDNIANLILDALKRENQTLEDGDIILIAETLISKAEGNFIKLGDILPSDDAIIFAKKSQKDSKLVEAIIQEAREVVEVGPDFIITETVSTVHHSEMVIKIFIAFQNNILKFKLYIAHFSDSPHTRYCLSHSADCPRCSSSSLPTLLYLIGILKRYSFTLKSSSSKTILSSMPSENRVA